MPNYSLYFYINSNKPNNRPMNQGVECDWGAYIICKQTANYNMGVIIFIETKIILRTQFYNTTQSLDW
jgi:hypothetical protein